MSYAQIAERWGTTSPVLNQATTIDVISDEPASDPIRLCPAIGDAGSIQVVGSLSVAAQGVLGSVTSSSPAAARLWSVDLGQSASPFVGLIFSDTTHAGLSWIDSASGNLATLTQPLANPFTPPGTYHYFPSEQNGLSAGDAYQILRPTQVQLLDFRPASHATVPLRFHAQAFLADLWVPSSNGSNVVTYAISNIAVAANVRVDRSLTVKAELPTEEDGQFSNCWVTGTVNAKNSALTGTYVIGGALNVNKTNAVNADGLLFDGDTIVHGLVVAGRISVGRAYFDGHVIIGNSQSCSIFPSGVYGTSVQWGPGSCTLNTGAVLNYHPPASSVLLLQGGYTINGLSTASAFDLGVDPAVWHPGRAITPANLDAPIADGGFAGAAIDLAAGARISADTL